MAEDNPDTSNMFAGIKKKKKKTVQIADLELEGESPRKEEKQPAAANSDTVDTNDAVRPLESSADLTLKDDGEPLDFSDLKKVHCIEWCTRWKDTY